MRTKRISISGIDSLFERQEHTHASNNVNSWHTSKLGFKQTEVGVIPSDWDVKAVAEAFEICNHLRYPISQEVRKTMSGIYPYYGPTKVQDYINEYRVEGEYALIGEDGDHFLKWRELPMTLLVNGKFNVNNHAHLITGKSNLTKWFFFYFCHKDLTPYLSRQGVGRYKLTKRALENILIPLPPISEQACIVEILDTADVTIRTTENLIEAKVKYKRAFAEKLLTGRYRCSRYIGLPGQHMIGNHAFPKDWQSVEIDKVANQVNIKNPELLSHPVLSCTKHGGLVFSSEYFGKRVHSEDLSSYKVVKRGQFAYATNHIEEGSIGLQNLCDIGLISPMYTVFEVNEKRVDLRFLFALLKTEIYRHQFEAATNGTVNRRGSLRWPGFAKLRIPLPSLEEQQYISATLGLLDEEIALLRRQLEAQKKQKQGLMQKLLTGAIRVKEFRK